MTQAIDGGAVAARIDPDALLVALVLVPQSYPRNRFHELFRDPVAKGVRRRAALLRSVIADLVDEASAVSVERGRDGISLSYRLEGVGVRRRTLLDENELALVKYAVDRSEPCDALGAAEDATHHLAKLLRGLYPPDR